MFKLIVLVLISMLLINCKPQEGLNVVVLENITLVRRGIESVCPTIICIYLSTYPCTRG